MTEAKTSLKRTLIGKVVSDKRAKTVTVLVERRVMHPIYGKIMIKSSKYHAHDEQGEFKMGDTIEITESRPLSKTKNWVATRLVQKAALVKAFNRSDCIVLKSDPQCGSLFCFRAGHIVCAASEYPSDSNHIGGHS